MNEDIWDILAKKLACETTPEENLIYDHWMLRKENKYIFDNIQRIRRVCDDKTAMEMKEPILDKTYDKIFSRKPANENKIGKLVIYLTSMAACITVIMTGLILFQNREKDEAMITYSCQTGISKVFLPDSTSVTLNAGSCISYNSNSFNDKKRKVTLLGEAFFEVSYHPDKPFIVQTEQIDIRVLGTVFNVKTGSDNETVETSLFAGSVELSERFSNEKIKMLPGQLSVYNKNTKKMNVYPIEVHHLPDWIRGDLIFNKVSFHFICQTLEQTFHKTFEIRNITIENKKFTGKFTSNESLTEILEIIRINVPFSYRIENDKVIIY
jgi:ferric-dicitrate binding protein FerR (iron transport regulator)